MSAYAVISALGSDRVGIVDDISALIVKKSCSIEESRMAVLGGEFAVIMLIEGDSTAVTDLIDQAGEIGEKLNLRMEARETTRQQPESAGVAYAIETTAMDTPGIVHAVTQIIRPFGISIHSCETNTSPAPWTGSPMFHMRAEVVIPAGVSVPEVKDHLNDLAHERDMDISLIPVRST